MAASAQRALPFDVPGPLLYHNVERPGFFALLRRADTATGMLQVCLHLSDLPEVVERAHGVLDLWISVGEFFKPNRRVVNLWRMAAGFADLDTYKMPALAKLSTQAQVELLLQACYPRHPAPVGRRLLGARSAGQMDFCRTHPPKGTAPMAGGAA